MSWTYIVLIICCLVAVFAVWKEYNRLNRSYLILRIVASLMAVAALACIVLPVNYWKDITRQGDNSTILLTAGFEPDSLINYRNSKLFTTDRSIEKAYPKAKLIRLDELKTDSPAISKLHVFGYGLNENELKQLDHLSLDFHPAPIPGGITAIDGNQKLKTGEALKVQGKYKNDSSKPVKLVLKGLNTQLDTATIAAKTNGDFELNAVPKNEGRAVYHLLAITGRDTLANENLPVEIDPIKQLKILILSASPDFETRFLKNWLSENGFSVTVRSAISKDKFSSEYVNMQPLKVDHLSGALLDKFDLIIGDLSVLKSESALLKQQVMEKGLGVIIRADSSSKALSWLQNDFPVEKLNVRNPPPVSLTIKGKKDRLALLKIDPNYISLRPGTQPLVYDAQNHLLVNTSLAGAGRLAFTTISNTYNWVLGGNKDDYGAFWSLLISKVARKMPVNEGWSVTPQLPTVNEPLQLQLETSSVPGQINADSSVPMIIGIAPEQNPAIPFEWNNTYWPATTGWHSVKQNNGQAVWFYVYGDNEWQTLRSVKKLTATHRYAETYAVNASVTKQIHEKMRIEVPKIYFYLLLLLAVTFLWVEGKGLTLPSPKERVLK
jgi:hypothetical protein